MQAMLRTSLLSMLLAALPVLGWAPEARSADLAVAAPPPEPIEAAEFEKRWAFAAGAYVWAAGLDGTIGVGPLGPVDVNASFSDILDNLDFAFMAVLEARYDRFGVFSDLLYTHLSADGSGPLGILTASASNELFAGTLMGEYRVVQEGRSSLDVMAGARLWRVSGDLKLSGPAGPVARGGFEKTWLDPMIGLKGRLQGDSRWYATGWGMVGGFGAGADIDWDLLAAVGYEVTDHISLVAGYRALGVDYEDDDFLFDVVQHGPVISGIVRF